jgi:hypothetical protein
MLVGGIIVENHMDRFAVCHRALDGVEKADEFLMPMALHAAPDDLALEDVESGEQGGGASGFRSGLDPATQAFRLGPPTLHDVDARNKSGQGIFQMVPASA